MLELSLPPPDLRLGGRLARYLAVKTFITKMSNSSFVTEAFTLLALGLFIIGLRTALRIKQVGFREFQADDYLMLVAAVSFMHLPDLDSPSE